VLTLLADAQQTCLLPPSYLRG